jgi:transposase
MWHPTNEPVDGERAEPGVEGRLGSAVERNRITERADRGYDRRIEPIAKEVYPQVALLKQVKGVGTLIALIYILMDDPHRFRRSQDAGCFVGSRPGRRTLV